MGLKRSHTCGELRVNNAGDVVTIAGWVNKVRDLGGIRFVDLRDRYGLTQVVFDPSIAEDAHTEGMKLKPEWVVTVQGTVARRPVGQENEDMPTGEIEIKAEAVQIDNECPTPPIYIDRDGDEDRDTRWRYRYLELRRKSMQEKIIIRHKIFRYIRDFLNDRGFLDIETPFLTKSTPEGARDFIIPSRFEPGKFYALPQSPQMFKQLCMIAGYDKYYQIVRCFRDEDMRADRALEFTQLDLEMSFVDQNDIFELSEELFTGLFKEVAGVELKSPYPRLKYHDAMEKYGTDKPDIRFGLKFIDLTEVLNDSQVRIFKATLDSGGIIKGIKLPGITPSRTETDAYTEFVQSLGAKGLANFIMESSGMRSPLAKHLSEEEKEGIIEAAKLEVGDTLFVMADKKESVLPILGELRLKFGNDYNMIPDDKFAFIWVYDFPLFEYSEHEGKIVSEHHPFTAPNWEHWNEWIEKGKHREIEEVRHIGSQSYDLVINGIEVGSGSVRIHKPEVQREVFRILGLTDEEIDEQFGFMIEALSYGAPPHAGIAPGLDRIVRMITGDESIADIIPFPKTLKGADLMTGSPSFLYNATTIQRKYWTIYEYYIKHWEKRFPEYVFSNNEAKVILDKFRENTELENINDDNLKRLLYFSTKCVGISMAVEPGLSHALGISDLNTFYNIITYCINIIIEVRNEGDISCLLKGIEELETHLSRLDEEQRFRTLVLCTRNLNALHFTQNELAEIINNNEIISCLSNLYEHELRRPFDPVALCTWGPILFRENNHPESIIACRDMIRHHQEWVDIHPDYWSHDKLKGST